MTPRKLKVFIALFAYGGNGATSSQSPAIALWLAKTMLKMKSDPRIENVDVSVISDTPITMTRNYAVLKARESGADLLLMVDSDQNPQLHEDDPWHKPFWDVAFDEVYAHYDKGPLVIGAPYCGPPPMENVYVFHFRDNMTGAGHDETGWSLEQYNRDEAAKLSGVQEVGALPTGMILFDMRAFELVEPGSNCWEDTLESYRDGKMTTYECIRALSKGWFYYEWKNQYASEKASTEDVTATRDIAIAGYLKLGYNPLRCAWDSWIGHYKPWCVGKPAKFSIDHVGGVIQRAVLDAKSHRDKIVNLKPHPMIEALMRRQGMIHADDALLETGNGRAQEA